MVHSHNFKIWKKGYTMNDFVIKETNNSDYDRFLLWLSSESLTDNLGSIEKTLNMIDSSGKLLIDQLFITGDGDNRFLCCDFENGKLDFKTAHIVSPADSFREETVQWLRDNYQYVEYSILTESRRQKIKDDITF